MERVLVSHNAGDRISFEQLWQAELERLEYVVATYDSMGYGKLTTPELDQLLNNTTHFLYGKMTGGEQAHLTIGKGDDRSHLAIDKKKAMELITKPAGYNDLCAAIGDFAEKCLKRASLRQPTASYNIQETKRYFEIDKNGNPVYTAVTKNVLKEAGNIYVYSKKGIAAFKFIKALEKAIVENDIDKANYEIEDIGFVINKLTKRFNKDTRTITVNDGFLNLDAQWRQREQE